MWVQAASRGSPPPARSSHTLCEVQGNLILFGGEAQPRVPVPPDTFVFDAARQTWITVSLEGESPSARVGHSAASIGSCMLLFGGRTGVEGGTAMNDLHSLDLAARCWHCLASEGSKPQPRSYHSATSLASCLYIFGGCGADGRLNDLWCYDSEANSWAQLPHSEQIKVCTTSVGQALLSLSQLCIHIRTALRLAWLSPDTDFIMIICLCMLGIEVPRS